MDTRKISKHALLDSFNSIGIKGTAIRGLDFIASRFDEQRLLRKYVDSHVMRGILSDAIPARKVQPNLECDDAIWVCWFQGMENAPELVKKCFQSLNKCNPGRNIRLITEDVISDYVKFPESINKRYAEGGLSLPHYSDILRASLLYCYGGIWVDSTMLFTDAIPDFIWNSDLFLFKFAPHESKYQVASNQFIRAHAGNEILRRTLNGLFYYWEHTEKPISYYIFHYIFAAAVESDEELKEQFNKIPLMLSQSNHILQWRLFEPFSAEEWGGVMRALICA